MSEDQRQSVYISGFQAGDEWRKKWEQEQKIMFIVKQQNVAFWVVFIDLDGQYFGTNFMEYVLIPLKREVHPEM